MSLNGIKQVLYDAMGLKDETIGESALTNAVQRRLASLNLDTKEKYLDTLKASKDEIQALIEEIVIPETWFFRDLEPFKALARVCRDIAKTRNVSREPIRILSIPSSTGEEPYSIAMTLLEAGIGPESFKVEAFDISHVSIAIARKGEYGKNSFRGQQDARVVNKYFNRIGSIFSIDDLPRSCVSFTQGNIFDERLLPGVGIFDIVFCRNMLIYFDQEKKNFAFRKLERLLKMKGYMFLGHSEAGIVPATEYTSYPHPRSFAFIKEKPRKTTIAGEISGKAKAKPRVATAQVIGKKNQTNRKPVTQKKSVSEAHNPTAGNTPVPVNLLDAARKYADNGSFSEAMELCEQFIIQEPENAEVYLLLGIILNAQKLPNEAEEYFRKSLYLDPKQPEALFHLAYLLESKGEFNESERMKERAKRLKGAA